MNGTITLPRSVVEQALEALNPTASGNWTSTIALNAEAAIHALRAALEQPQDHPEQHLDMVPTGWKLVPVELTDSQIRAAQDTWWHACNSEMYWDQIYAAMLAAAPQPPAGEKTQPEIDHAHELRRHSRKLGEPVGETAGVMQRAADEIERLRAMLAAASQPKLYPLPDDLYGGSKDWRAGSYAERVEWLHLMYEGAKEEIERLGQTQGEQEPVAWMHTNAAGDRYFRKKPHDKVFNPQPVYTHPLRQPLTKGEIFKAIRPLCNNDTNCQAIIELSIDEYRAIERAHGIGGEA